MINTPKTSQITKIYLVTNCFGDPNKVYIGKEKYPKIGKRIYKHKITFGEDIIFSYIDECEGWDSKNWKSLECFWIEQFKQWGFNIQNKNNGGGGPIYYSKDQKEKMSKSHIGFKHSEETKDKIRQFRKGKVLSEETKNKMSKNSFWKGKERPQETKNKLRGQKRSKETKEKMKLKFLSIESKEKIGKSNSKPKPKGFGDNLSKLMKEGLAEKIGKANLGISRNKGRKNPWSKGNNKVTIIYQFLGNTLINKWIGTKELDKEFGLSGVYRSIKTGKEYKSYLWKKETTTRQEL